MTGIDKFKQYEKTLKERHKTGERIFTISGLPGRGKSTLARFLASEFDLEVFTAGDFHRKEADKRSLSIGEFMQHIEEIEKEENVDFDLKLDRKILEKAYKEDGIIFDSHLAGVLLKEVAEIRILVECDLEVAAERVAEREGWSKEEASGHVKKRSEKEKNWYKKIYNINLVDRKYYNIIIDNSRSLKKTKNDLLDKVKKKLE